MRSNIIELKNITKKYYEGTENEFAALEDVSLDIKNGEFISVVGESGSGKSTLMNIIGALDRPTEGTYLLDGVNVEEEKDKVLSKIRNQKIGFVFQTFNLIGRASAKRNVELPMLYAHIPQKERTPRSLELLTMVGMADRIKHRPNELSGGQKQRVAIARAMANDPQVILADEPTGALDSRTGRMVMDIFHRLHEEKGKTIILITHNHELAEETERIITLHDGVIISEKTPEGRAK
jgi:putative ABC transport system ATP-binding protein